MSALLCCRPLRDGDVHVDDVVDVVDVVDVASIVMTVSSCSVSRYMMGSLQRFTSAGYLPSACTRFHCCCLWSALAGTAGPALALVFLVLSCVWSGLGDRLYTVSPSLNSVHSHWKQKRQYQNWTKQGKYPTKHCCKVSKIQDTFHHTIKGTARSYN